MTFPIRFGLITLVLLLSGRFAAAQQPDSVQVVPDSLLTARPDSFVPGESTSPFTRFFKKDYPNPRRAALLSFVFPGGGQMYNQKWWKVPIVYGALGAALYFEIDNIKEYRALRDNYKLLVDGDPNTNPTEPPYNRIDATSMKTYRDQWRRYVEMSSLVLGLAYLLQVTDAYVDAHLKNFNVSDDLSLRFKPTLESVPGFGATFGAGVSLQFGNSGR